MTINFKDIEKKWQAAWEKNKVFQVEVDDYQKKKFYLTTPYPYMSGLLHLGHLFTYMAPETLARFKRMQGHNVLFKYGFHCTGTPIVAAAKKVAEKEPKQIAALEKMGISKEEILKFSEPEHWIQYFPKETLRDIKSMGFVVDERYTFITTSLNKPYDAFIKWQFNKLKEKGYAKKGKHPVVWCPKDNAPTGDHARSEGEGETPQEYLLFKHKLEDGRYLITATLRPDTVMGTTNLYMNPEAKYTEAEVNGEKWVLNDNCAKNLKEQGHEVNIIEKVSGKEFIGKKVEEFGNRKVIILPATFLDLDFGTGLVHSVPSDSTDDLIALRDLQKDETTCEKYGLDINEIKKIQPIPVLNTPGLGNIAAEAMLKKYNIKSQNEREKLEKIKKELYKLSHFTATLNEKYKENFSENLEGKRVEEAKEIISNDLIKGGWALKYYELSGKVVCRCLTECIVKMVENQWFLEYNDKKWKEVAHECLDSMKIYPEVLRKQFDYVLDWLHRWACARELGLGTRLPWDENWVIESLSDSTIQMAYNTISKYLEHPEEYGFSVDQLNDEFFDYVHLNKGTAEKVEASTGVPIKMIETMKKDFEYWYPFDFRNSAKDLIQNHLAFCIFNHTAIFPKEHWPKSFMINGRIMINNEKMSKSKGNFFTMRELHDKHGADIIRLTASNAGEGSDDANYDMGFHDIAKRKLNELYDFVKENYNKGRTDKLLIDQWFESKINETIGKTTIAFENMQFKSAIQFSLLDLQRHLKWYLKRTKDQPNKELINLLIETQIKLLAPVIPHFCEECWELIKGKEFVSNAAWPEANQEAIKPELDLGEELLKNNISDIREVMKLAKIDQPKAIKLFVAADWKYGFVEKFKELIKETRNPGEILKTLMQSELKQHGKDISKLVPALIKDQSKLPAKELTKKNEIAALEESKGLIAEEFGCSVEVVIDSDHNKAKSAMPGKVGILVE
ncbi:leucine--tRNA ligase [Candidatus Woesearchaeota archaeon]|jgi:leucyl-tRNA synthetase|nr:leucine--tRNA ligase [Candidatus Woesearchaeota archaeon]MBT4110916.1 leucine--tRNA ligase [Candidatus Woesearchaeota archaeon]MBT4336572.1 leucine--tRNA ligase [Candidatus Woesearchaeota archaeon]MBT4469679.1 leucine--tRNA ligase [Candidatus Woesearchaeota archaeon]MBT6744041.1 leucine--tRNA ligase [Candidatus Woesearchaeota archaeon]